MVDIGGGGVDIMVVKRVFDEQRQLHALGKEHIECLGHGRFLVVRQLCSACAEDLDPVVLEGIVRCGHHRTRKTPDCAEVCHPRCRQDADVENTGPAVDDPGDQRGRQDGPRDPGVTPNHDGIGPENFNDRTPEGIGHLDGELSECRSADAVGSEGDRRHKSTLRVLRCLTSLLEAVLL